MERLNSDCAVQETNGRIMLLYIQGTARANVALQRAAQRIKCNIRHDDSVLLLNEVCAVVLVETPFAGAQAVARRIYTLLADVEYELQIVSGLAAQLLLQKLYNEGAAPVLAELEAMEHGPLAEAVQMLESINEDNTLPYLAFLVNYPSHRLLHLFPYELACRYRCIPVGVERDMLTVAASHRLTCEALAHLRETTRRTIFQVRCEAGIIDDVLHYWQNRIQRQHNPSTG